MAKAYIDSKNNTIILHDKESKLTETEAHNIKETTVAAGYSFIYLTEKIELYVNNDEVIKLS
ncbi:hypothetical protein [Mammaliicoccus sciuri]|uniref:hypothetical protein n=1 Tax=Mammaliicoccus sciuri TaxID=1296 RepID=UPI002B260FEC|nr:hypothetical protein [Mammaliicoccus sciuri]WQK75298.1 hypothetical protein P3U33_06070 [Mammaliicoccus sciuri]